MWLNLSLRVQVSRLLGREDEKFLGFSFITDANLSRPHGQYGGGNWGQKMKKLAEFFLPNSSIIATQSKKENLIPSLPKMPPSIQPLPLTPLLFNSILFSLIINSTQSWNQHPKLLKSPSIHQHPKFFIQSS